MFMRHTLRRLVLWSVVLIWVLPLVWAAAVSFRPPAAALGSGSTWYGGGLSMHNYVTAWRVIAPSYLNSVIIVVGILGVQLVTITLAGFAFARMSFWGKNWIFSVLLIQIMIPTAVLSIPLFFIIRTLGLYDTLLAVMVPYFGSVFGTFLMRQTFREVPIELEEAARIDGAGIVAVMRHIYLPAAVPGLIAFSLASIVYHWNEFLLPLLVTANRAMPLSVRLSILATTEGGIQWPQLGAATMLVMLPPLLLFVILQRQFIQSFLRSGLR